MSRFFLGAPPAAGALTTPAYSPAVRGDRIFQAALGIDDPGVGAVGELHFFFDDIFSDSLGKPLFGGVK